MAFRFESLEVGRKALGFAPDAAVVTGDIPRG